MRDAFMALDHSKSGAVTQDDFKVFLTHWGVKTTEEKFSELFNYFDADKDGEISYKDFLGTVGQEMQPDQGCYWRRDMARPTRIKSCKSDHCWHTA
jgi:Ca2+-binding EF-hand superfamily protein